MATAKDFITHVDRIHGVSGSLLVRADGALLGQSLEDPELYSTLLGVSGATLAGVKGSVDFGCCRQLSFNRENQQGFHVFPIGRYLLGVLQSADCREPEMFAAVQRLIGRVSTGAGKGA